MKIGEFFKSLLSADGEVSSKRFAGLVLIATAIAGAIMSYSIPAFTEVAESMAKTMLFTGAGLLGLNVAEAVVKTVKRPVVVEVKEDGDKD